MIRVCNGIEQKNALRRLVIAEPESVDNFIFDFHISSGGWRTCRLAFFSTVALDISKHSILRMISMNRPVRRVITGLNKYGQSTIVIDDTSAIGRHNVLTTASRCLTYIWRGRCGPAALDEVAETVRGGLTINPPAHGAVFRVIEIAPDQDAPNDHAAFFRDVSGEDTQTAGHSIHPGMHKTPTIDFLVVLRGEVWLLLECGETRLRTGDCLVQRGTIHAWSNRTNESCQCAIVMLDAV